MKKFLALVLALVMTMSLVTISSSAAKYSDDADIDYDEAVAVLSSVGVLQGADGKFDPKANLTREQAAKIIAYLDLGEKVAESLPAVKVFNDVAADRWSAKYVAYCADAGYVAGVGNGNFNPAGELTGYAFAKMLLCVLGYDAKIEAMTGDSWKIAVAKLMTSNEISKKVEKSGDAVMTREEAAQFALNALKATMVDYDTKGTTIVVGGVDITTGASKAYALTAKTDWADAIIGDADPDTYDTVELGEKLYEGKLTYDQTANTDDFGRPCNVWEYKGTKVAEGVSEALVTYTGNMDTTAGKKQLLNDLKGYKFYDGDTDEYVELKSKTTEFDNGDAIIDWIAGLTANGKVLEIYANTSKQVTDTNEIVYTVEKISNVTTNKDGDVTYTLSASGPLKDYADDYAHEDEIVLHGSFAKKDVVTTVAGVNSTAVHVYPTTKVVGKQTANKGNTLTISGTKYDLAMGVTGIVTTKFVNGTKDANYFLDQFGYVVDCSDVEADLVYAVVNAIAGKTSETGLSTGARSAQAELVLTDGSKVTVDVAKINGIKVKDFTISKDAANDGAQSTTAVTLNVAGEHNPALAGQIVTYTVDSDGKYELIYGDDTVKFVTTTAGVALTNKGVPAFGKEKSAGVMALANAATAYVVKTTKDDKDVFTAYTGFANVPTIKAAVGETLTAVYAIEDGKVLFVYIDATENSEVGDVTVTNIFYAHKATIEEAGTGSNKVYSIEGILNGEAADIKAKAAKEDDAAVYGIEADTFYNLEIDEDGYVTDYDLVDWTADGKVCKAVTQDVIDTIAGGSFNGYLYNDKTEIYVIDGGDVEAGTVESATLGDAVYIILDKNASTEAGKNTIKTMYIVVDGAALLP